MTNAEKMRKIYEATGIEPEWWCNPEYMNANMTLSRMDRDSKPYYPCKQLWDMLPRDIDDGNYFLECYKGRLVYKSWADSRHEVPDLKQIDFEDLHTALLDMTIWAIEEGYIK